MSDRLDSHQRRRMALAVVAGIVIEVAIVAAGRWYLVEHRATYFCAPAPSNGEDPYMYGLGCIAPTASRYVVVLSAYWLGLLSVLGVVGSTARRIGLGSGHLLEAFGVASIAAGPILFAGLVVQHAGAVEGWGWVVAILVVPAALAGWTFAGRGRRLPDGGLH